MEWLTSNWKTSLVGVAIFIIGGLVYTGLLDEKTAVAFIAFISGGGHILSKDVNK